MSESKLYTAATESLVADATNNSCFGKFVEAGFAASTLDEFKIQVKNTEQEIKRDFSLKSMPNPWRSAKSVVFNAMELRIPLMDENGNPRGKTNLQVAIAAEKTKATTTSDDPTKDFVISILGKLGRLTPEVDVNEVKKALQTWIDTCH